eukprot:UN10012
MGISVSLTNCAPNTAPSRPQHFINIERPFCGLDNPKKELNREKIEKERFIKRRNSVTLQNSENTKQNIKQNKTHVLVHRADTYNFNGNLKRKHKRSNAQPITIKVRNKNNSIQNTEKPSHPIIPLRNEFIHPKHDGDLNIHFRHNMPRCHTRNRARIKLPMPPPRRDSKTYIIRITSTSMNEYELSKQGIPIDVNDLYDAEDEETEDDESDIYDAYSQEI